MNFAVPPLVQTVVAGSLSVGRYDPAI